MSYDTCYFFMFLCNNMTRIHCTVYTFFYCFNAIANKDNPILHINNSPLGNECESYVFSLSNMQTNPF